jgi:tRNA (guanine-N7-)-methyltransferase
MPIEKAQAVESTRLAELQTQLKAVVHTWPQDITLEIGCGHGHFLAAYAAAHPNEYCVGIDIIRDRLERADRKTTRANLTNVSFLLSDARMMVEHLPANMRLNRIFVLFPDPWPKRRHHKNRLIKPDFLDILAKRATPDATLYFRTDHEHYFEEAYSTLRNHPCWNINEREWPFEYETVFQSRAPAHQSFIAMVHKLA